MPLLILAGYSYWYAQGLIRSTVDNQLKETAVTVGRELDVAGSRIDSILGHLASDLAGAAEWNEESGDMGLRVAEEPLLSTASSISVRMASGDRRYLVGSPSSDSVRCCAGGMSRRMEFSRALEGEPPTGTVAIEYWVGDLISARSPNSSHTVLVLDPETGRILYASNPSMATPAGGVPPALAGRFHDPDEGGDLGTFRFEEAGQERVAAYSRAQNRGLVVVAATIPALVGLSLDRLVALYWAFVIVLALSTSLAFSVLLGRFTRSLGELSRAAEEIGMGELDPWLPLSASGEVGQLTLAFSRMLARIRQMMKQVDQNGRLAVVGQLSAYLAHEIRNPLSSIKLNLQRLRRWTKNGSIPEFCLEPVEISLKEVERLSASVAGVLELSASQDAPKELLSLHTLVEEAGDLLSARFRRQGVSLELELDARADRVLARVGQVKSVILNLMVNALEAQPSGGSLRITSELGTGLDTGGPALALHFKDQGPGVPPEIRDRVFEPFFTTKPGGSGIGLAMAIQSIRDNGGDLYVLPSLGSETGAEFVVVLPLAPAEEHIRGEFGPLDDGPGFGGRTSGGSRRRGDADAGGKVPAHLLTPEGLRAVLSLSPKDPDDPK